MWDAHPRWAKFYMIFVGLPAWCFLVVRFFVSDPLLEFTTFDNIAVGLVVSAAIIHVIVLFRAFWKLKI